MGDHQCVIQRLTNIRDGIVNTLYNLQTRFNHGHIDIGRCHRWQTFNRHGQRSGIVQHSLRTGCPNITHLIHHACCDKDDETVIGRHVIARRASRTERERHCRPISRTTCNHRNRQGSVIISGEQSTAGSRRGHQRAAYILQPNGKIIHYRKIRSGSLGQRHLQSISHRLTNRHIGACGVRFTRGKKLFRQRRHRHLHRRIITGCVSPLMIRGDIIRWIKGRCRRIV